MIEADAVVLAERIREDFPALPEVSIPEWHTCPAAKVIDCVLSLRKSYKRVVVPRVRAFISRHPQVRSCDDLRVLIRTFATPAEFVSTELKMNSPGKSEMLVGVLEYLIDTQRRFDAPDESSRLHLWAHWARPGDYLTLDVHGFKLAGFQYLRILFGASTVKPDVWILGYVEQSLGRAISGQPAREVQAVYALERAAELLGQSARSIDIAIWERGTGQRLHS